MRMRILGLFFAFATVALGLTACFRIDNQFSGLPPGPWRGVLELEPRPITPNPKGEPLPEKVNMQFEPVTEGQLPFNFEVVYTDDTTFHIELINGEERIRVDDISMGLDRSTANDTVVINFPVYDTYLKGIFEENILEGEWVVNNRGKEYAIPFVARYGKRHRFTNLRKEPVMDISGKWEATFEIDRDTPFPAIGEFQQDGNHLTGTFITPTGDYRYLEGAVQEDKVYLSTFDGSHAYLFEAKIRADSTMIGSFWSGKHYRTIWEAKYNPDFELPDPDTLTKLSGPDRKIEFSFENPAGERISLDDPAYQGKVKIVQLMGTWCPNCRDETNFLKSYLKEHPSQDLAVIALAFERYREKDKALAAIRKFKEQLNIPYEVVWGGYYDKAEAARQLPFIEQVISYPTMIFLDRENRVQRIHTGFAGPATEKYPAFVADFKSYVQKLLAGKTTEHDSEI